MAKYLFLDQASARHPAVMGSLDDPDARAVISDAYLAEFSRWVPEKVARHFERLSQMRDRVYFAEAASACIKREIKTLKRTNRGHVIHSEGTAWLRRQLADPLRLARMNTEDELRKIVIEDRYSDPRNHANYVGMVKVFEAAMARTGFHAKTHDAPIADDELVEMVELARLCVYRYIRHHGHSETAARKFALGDSYLLREVGARLCRIADWAQARGIGDQSEGQIFSENIDLEYVSISTYFDDFLVYEKRSRRNIDNVRRMLSLAPSIRKMRAATVPRHPGSV